MPPENSSKEIFSTDPAPAAGPVLAEKKPEKTAYTTSPFGQTEKSPYTPNPDLKSLRTYQGDMEETIGKKKESLVSIIAAEQKPEKKSALEFAPVNDKHKV